MLWSWQLEATEWHLDDSNFSAYVFVFHTMVSTEVYELMGLCKECEAGALLSIVTETKCEEEVKVYQVP